FLPPPIQSFAFTPLQGGLQLRLLEPPSMVVDEHGAKWACDACLKGHRVTNCHHEDRKLFFVPGKGRPPTQCQHCREERKRRGAHSSCQCGAKKRAKDPNRGDSIEASDDADLCQCMHHAKCICTLLKKERGTLDELFVADDAPSKPKPITKAKPRLTATQSETHLTVFANGHHKPIHRNNNAAQECGVPYVRSRPQTMHGTAGARHRSVESLPLARNADTMALLTQKQSRTNGMPQDVRPTVSERGSPQFGATNLTCPPLPLRPCSMIGFPPPPALQPRFIYNNASILPDPGSASSDFDVPLYSAGTIAPADPWSFLGMPEMPGAVLGPQLPLGTSADIKLAMQPALTAASSSNARSDIDDIPLFDEPRTHDRHGSVLDVHEVPAAVSMVDDKPARMNLDPCNATNLDGQPSSRWSLPASLTNMTQSGYSYSVSSGPQLPTVLQGTQTPASDPIKDHLIDLTSGELYQSTSAVPKSANAPLVFNDVSSYLEAVPRRLSSGLDTANIDAWLAQYEFKNSPLNSSDQQNSNNNHFLGNDDEPVDMIFSTLDTGMNQFGTTSSRYNTGSSSIGLSSYPLSIVNEPFDLNGVGSKPVTTYHST
ncbi:hypothetical protein B0A49_12217, partial [Cryomyces minteri]